MESYQKLKDIHFDINNYDDDIWFCEQENISYCAFSDEPIQDPVIIISEYTLAHYKYYVSVCCLRNLKKFYECLGTQPLKIIFRNNINDDIVRHFGLNKISDLNLDRKYYIQTNELYLDTNEIYMNNNENGYMKSNEQEDSESDESDSGESEENDNEFSDNEFSDNELEELKEIKLQ
jgi:hypothetical protein